MIINHLITIVVIVNKLKSCDGLIDWVINGNGEVEKVHFHIPSIFKHAGTYIFLNEKKENYTLFKSMYFTAII